MCDECDSHFPNKSDAGLLPEALKIASTLTKTFDIVRPSPESIVYLLAASLALEGTIREMVGAGSPQHLTPTMDKIATRTAELAMKYFLFACGKGPFPDVGGARERQEQDLMV